MLPSSLVQVNLESLQRKESAFSTEPQPDGILHQTAANPNSIHALEMLLHVETTAPTNVGEAPGPTMAARPTMAAGGSGAHDTLNFQSRKSSHKTNMHST